MPPERYPGMREFATNAFKGVPTSEHGALTRRMKYFLERAKSEGQATTMNWAAENVHSLEKKFGPMPPTSAQPATNGSEKRPAPPKLGAAKHKTPTNSTNRVTNFTPDEKNGRKRVAESASIAPSKRQGSPKMPRTSTQPDTASVPSMASMMPMTPMMSMMPMMPMDPMVPMDPMMPMVPPAGPPKGSTAGFNTNNDGIKRPPKTSNAQRAERMQRFQNGPSRESSPAPYMEEQIRGTIVGTSEALEKPYFRLTGQVNPATVRPPHVLAKSLKHVLGKYEQDRENYSYVSSQLQSIRQDLMVQHIESPLTVEAYEQNARIALSHDDLGEFNKCLTRVLDLYEKHEELGSNNCEFRAYFIYYKLLLRQWDELSLILTRENDTGFEWPPFRGTPETGSKNKSTELAYPQTPELQRELLGRVLACVHCAAQQTMITQWLNLDSAWPLESVLLNKIIERERVRGLEGLLAATTSQNQVLPLAHICIWMSLNAHELKAWLQKLGVPFDPKLGLSSVDALPAVRKVAAQYLGKFDIKGQK